MTPNINKILKDTPRLCGFHNEKNQFVCTGSHMGDINRADDLSEPLYVQKLRFIDGDYALDGTYWGTPADIYCGFNLQTNVRVFFRAKNRELAKLRILENYPTAKFYI